jgi:hypothetical protein
MPDNQESPTGNNPETPPEWFDETYSDPQNSGEAAGAVQQQLFESTPDDPEQRVATYLGSLMERGVLESDSEERAQDQPGDEEYDQAAADMNRIAAIAERVLGERQELTARDVYFLRKYDSETQNFGYDKDPRIDELLQDRDASADLDMMLENFDPAELARDLMHNDWKGVIANNLDKFQPGAVDHTELVWALINSGMDDTFAQNLDKFLQSESLDQNQLAWDMMNRGEAHILARNLDKFQDGAVPQVRLAWDLLESGPGGQNILAENLEKFLQSGDPDQAERVHDLLEFDPRGKNIIPENLDKFLQAEAIDHAQLAWDMMYDGKELLLVLNLEKFPDGAIDHEELARRMMDKGLEHVLVANLDKFPPEAVDQAELARRLMNNNLKSILARNLHKFREVPDDVRDKLSG